MTLLFRNTFRSDPPVLDRGSFAAVPVKVVFEVSVVLRAFVVEDPSSAVGDPVARSPDEVVPS